MIKTIKTVCVFALGLSLAACVDNKPVYKAGFVIHAPTTKSGQRCVKRCRNHKKTCDRACGSNHEQCLFNEHLKAKNRYQRYVDQMLTAGKKIQRTESSFIDRHICNLTCECASTYKNCYSICGGGISEEQVCMENCKQ